MTIGQQRRAKEIKNGIIKNDQVTEVYTNCWGWIVGKFEGQPVKWTWATETWFYDV